MTVWRWLLIALGALGLGCGSPAVLVVGIDSGDWDVIEPLVESGHLPNIGRIIDSGARANLDCYPAMPQLACFCPPVWTSIITGHPWEVHGYSSWNQESSDRRVKAIWNVLAERGGTTSIISTRGSWPPEEDVDWVMTEEGLDAASFEIFQRHPQPKARDLVRLRDLENRTRPSDLFEQLGLLPHLGPRPAVWKMIGRDRVAMEGLYRLATRIERTDLTIITLHSPDKSAHIHWGWIQTQMGAPILERNLLAIADLYYGPVEGPKPYGNGTVSSQYQELDAWLGELLAAVDYRYIVLVSDHGMTRTVDGAGQAGGHGPRYTEAHDGIFAVSGPGVVAGAILDTVSVFDVAPTLAYLLNLPVADDLPGRVIVEAFEDVRLRLLPIATVATWEGDGAQATVAVPFPPRAAAALARPPR